jgi:carbamoyltransferase
MSKATRRAGRPLQDGPVLGINCFSHDTSACILVDGRAVALGEEERFNRDRHTRAFPDEAISFCLQAAGVKMGDLAAVAFAHDAARDFARGGLDALRRVAVKRLAAQAYVDGRLVARERAFRRRYGYEGPLVHVGHHDAHAASAFFPSPFSEAAVLTLDRGGDFLSTTLQLGRGNRLRSLAELRNPDSLGEVYTAVTWFLGFRPNADEGKVMGLAPYGSDSLVGDFSPLVIPRRDGLFKVDLSWFAYQKEGDPVSGRFRARFGEPRQPESEITERDKELAFAVQRRTEEVGLHVARELRRLSGLSRLCMAGGVALNTVMNTRILEAAGFEEVFVQPASSDAGNSLGAALFVWHQVLGQPRGWSLESAFLGAEPAAAEMARALKAKGVSFREVADPAGEAARLVAAGKVVGYFEGRAEIGPRALGARSILADARRAEMRDVVNHRVKHREWFRPFAPAVLAERGADYFSPYHENDFMMLVSDVRADKRETIPSVTHVDGTGRLQSVRAESNPHLHGVLSELERLTGVPVLLNTSFNVRGEPIVHRPSEAVADYLATEMDALVMGPFVALKVQQESENPPSV